MVLGALWPGKLTPVIQVVLERIQRRIQEFSA